MVRSIFHFLRLVRWPNLLMMLLSQWLIRYAMIKPSLSVLIPEQEIYFIISWEYFTILTLSMACIAAAGYIINDYFDISLDEINKPNKVIISTAISSKLALQAYWILNISGLLLAFIVCFKYELLSLFFIFPLACGILWFYSSTYKHLLIIGNVLIALLSSLVPLIPGMFDIILINQGPQLSQINQSLPAGQFIHLNTLSYWMIGFSIFAFLYTLAREIIKDMQDLKGDQTIQSANTLPMAVGIKKTKYVITGLLLINILSLYFVHYLYLKDWFTFSYITIFIVGSTCVSIFHLWKGSTSDYFKKSSLWLKSAILFGILFSLVFYIILRFFII